MEAVLATPGFEGFEKRLEIEFFPAPATAGDGAARGLRNLSRSQLDQLLRHAECTIVSQLKNEGCDSYVLSESSLFVYPLKIILKTCGTTRLLKAVPSLLELTAEMKMTVRKCKYTRGTFMFPAVQPFPHNCFEDEVEYLEQYFGYMGGKAYVLGDLNIFPNWHLYLASSDSEVDNAAKVAASSCSNPEPTFTLEMCMTELDLSQAHQFFNADGSVSGLQMTNAAGIDMLLPKAEICDFAFEPCGYSMNALEGGAHSTIHVTPEDNMNYASYESMGYGPGEMDLQKLVNGVLSIFKPAKLAMSVFVNNRDLGDGGGSWGASVAPVGYTCVGTTRQELPHQGAVVFHTFELIAENSNSTTLFPSVSVLPLITEPGKSCNNLKVECTTLKKICDHDVQEIAYHFKGREILKVFAAKNVMCTYGCSEGDPYLYHLPTTAATMGPPVAAECRQGALAEYEVCQYLLIAARRYGLRVVGAAFKLQVGSGGDFTAASFAEILESVAVFLHTASRHADLPTFINISDMFIDLEVKFKGDLVTSSTVTGAGAAAVFVDDACAALAGRTGSTNWTPASTVAVDGIYSQ